MVLTYIRTGIPYGRLAMTIGMFLALLLAPSVVFAGPPFRTDDPEPVDYQHWEFYTATQYQQVRAGSRERPLISRPITAWRRTCSCTS